MDVPVTHMTTGCYRVVVARLADNNQRALDR